MINNTTPSSRDPRQEVPPLYSSDEAALRARRMLSMSDIVRPLPKPQQRPQVTSRDVLTSQLTVSYKETITTTTHIHDEYRSFEVDEVFTRISEIESEPFVVPEQPAAVDVPGVSIHSRVTDTILRTIRKAKDVDEKPARTKGLLRYGIAACAAMMILALTGYISIDTWVTNTEVKQVVAERSSQSSKSNVVFSEGEDEQDVTPSAVDSYKVAADLPRVLTIDKMNVRARVLPMSVTADGAMQAPINIFDSGWYGGSARPGNPGATVIDGHASGATREGLFAYLDTLEAGDQLSIERGDGNTYTYEVVYTEVVPLDQVDMTKLLTPYGGAEEGVNLITCTGKWLPDQKTYDHRVTVYTKRV